MGLVRTVWVCIAENARWKTSVLPEDIEAILLYTALQPKSSYALYVQNKRVTSMFFNVLFYMGIVRTVLVYIAENARWKTGVLTEDSFKHVFQSIILHGKSAYSVPLHCKECALKDGCFFRRYPSDPAMYRSVPAPKK